MHTSRQHNLFGIVIVIFCLSAISLQSQAASQNKHKTEASTKERLVLMPLRVPEEDKNLTGAMEAALVKGLQQKYDIFSGEQVSQKAHEIFMKENRNTAHKECDETKCMQNIAMAFQAELIATANVTKQDGSYFLALSIQNIFDNKVIQSESATCEKCTAVQVVGKLKELGGGAILVAQVSIGAESANSTQQASSAEARNMLSGEPEMIRIPDENYEIGKYEVTQGEWKSVMGNNPSEFANCGDRCPVDSISWDDTQKYIKKLNTKTGKNYRLPTEAEWEHACYGGATTRYCGGNDLDEVAWYGNLLQPGGNSGQRTHPVGLKKANGYGIYDMTGNVWELMQNNFYSEKFWQDFDEIKPANKKERAIKEKDRRFYASMYSMRGGSFMNGMNIEATSRSAYLTSIQGKIIGFRLARTLP